MKHPLVIPALADLRQDIAGEIPVDLIRTWLESDRSLETHSRLLEPFMRRGTLVKSDSAGLSKLSVARPLIEVLKLVNDPKEIIAAHGLAIGGRPVGVWIADDTEMFYPESVSTERVIEAMVSAQLANRKNPVQVGLAIHRGTFVEIAGGMFNEAADLVEDLAENFTRAGEILVVEPRESINYSTHTATVAPVENPEYPAPFSREFLGELRSYAPEHADALASRHAKSVAVILVRIFHEPQPLLLDQLAEYIAANSILTRVIGQFDVTKIKANGSLGIFHTSNDGVAADLALALRDALKTAGLISNVAVTRGEVFLFPLEQGGTEIAGGPVNIASKLAEDTEERGTVFLHESCAPHRTHPSVPFSITRSGVELRGVQA